MPRNVNGLPYSNKWKAKQKLDFEKKMNVKLEPRLEYYYSCLREDLMTDDQFLDFWTKDVIQRVLENENEDNRFSLVREVLERVLERR